VCFVWCVCVCVCVCVGVGGEGGLILCLYLFCSIVIKKKGLERCYVLVIALMVCMDHLTWSFCGRICVRFL
jgi:hypothetical protein